MKNNMLSLRKTFLILGLLSIASVALAMPLTGDHYTVTYENPGVYGAGSVSGTVSAPGDTVFFTPTQFKFLSGSGSASVSSGLVLTFTIKQGYAFTSLSFMESGDYSILDEAHVNVVAKVEAKNADTQAATLLTRGPDRPLVSVTTFDNFETTDWSITADALSLLGLGAPTTLRVTLDNELFASASTGSEGFIEKKYVGLKIGTEQVLTPNAVPEPASWSLLLAGMMAAMWVGKRRGRPDTGSSRNVLSIV